MINSLSRAQTVIFVCMCWIVPVELCPAQNIDRVQSRTVDAVRDQTPGIVRGDTPPAAEENGSKPAPKMQGDDEFGEQRILARRAHVEPWTVGVDSQYFYTDNVALTPHGALHDTYVRTGLYAQYANRISGDWFMDATVSSFFFLHDKYNFFDFNLLRTEVGLTRRLPWLNDAFASAHYYWFHVADAELSRTIFQSQMLNLSLQKMWKVSRGQQFTIGISTDLNLAAFPSGPGRNEFSIYAGHSLRLTEKWTVQAGLRGSYFQYPVLKRGDWNTALTLGLSYAVTDFMKLTFSAAGAMNRSNLPAFSYNNLVSGLGVSLQISF